jgi:energy-coupling factor transporter ATP-binding protein EcfA2
MQVTSNPTQIHYDYDAILKLVQRKGKDMFGKAYAITPLDLPVITKLITWFLRDEAMAKNENIQLDKGLLLSGPVGCGKTAILQILNTLCKSKYQFTVKSCKEITIAFSQNGYSSLEKYIGPVSGKKPDGISTFCFDDLGVEDNVSLWGKDCNVLAEILLLRYDRYLSHGLFTHITTNLNTQKLEERYGDRIRSRMRQMFNLIAFHPTSNDKRQ